MNEYLGHESLIETSHKKNFNKWLYQQISSNHIRGDILEIGSGTGTYSQMIVENFPDSNITLSDFSSTYVSNLRKRFSKKNLTIIKLDLDSKEDFNNIGDEMFDTIIGINVLDNVKNDEFSLEQLYRLLKKDGNLIVLLPSYKFLFNSLDENIGRLRRYSKQELENKIKKTHFHIEQIRYFNAVGMLGWYLNGKTGKSPKLSNSAFNVFDKMIPILKFIDIITQKKIGLSIVCCLKK